MSFFDSDKWRESIQIQQEAEDKYEEECDLYWDNISYDEKIKSFYSVCKRIRKGDIKDQGTYRYVLYDVFGFGPDAYAIGMQCGYMALHNCILPPEDVEELFRLRRENAEMNKLLSKLDDDGK